MEILRHCPFAPTAVCDCEPARDQIMSDANRDIYREILNDRPQGAAASLTRCWCRVLVGALAVLAFCTTLIATQRKIGPAPDSLAGIGTARRISNGGDVTYLATQ